MAASANREGPNGFSLSESRARRGCMVLSASPDAAGMASPLSAMLLVVSQSRRVRTHLSLLMIGAPLTCAVGHAGAAVCERGHPVRHRQHAWRSMGKMGGDAPTWIVPMI